jgi:hypothetical protein
MSFKHVVIWLDSHEAQLIHFDVDASGSEFERTRAGLSDSHSMTVIPAAGTTAVDARFFKEIVQGILGSIEILLIGPANEKHELMQYIVQHHRYTAQKIVGIITADHPAEGQLLTFARRYFKKIEQMRMDPIASLRAGVHG